MRLPAQQCLKPAPRVQCQALEAVVVTEEVADLHVAQLWSLAEKSVRLSMKHHQHLHAATAVQNFVTQFGCDTMADRILPVPSGVLWAA